MAKRSRATEHLSVAEAAAKWQTLLEKVARTGSRIILDQDGATVAALIPAVDLERLQRLDGVADEQSDAARLAASQEGIRRATGAWKGLVDADALTAYVADRRRARSRPSIQW